MCDSGLLHPARSVCVSSERFFINITVTIITITIIIIKGIYVALLKSKNTANALKSANEQICL